ncbi:hypothetical protein HPP92_003895 [Vanilla planifolia]|uniref:Uncharacterized protein n=1 Tax=Vanilla planifolia TaxID=51239 RepID=A0A835SHL1_VANPL|nr:hypothetical protein HPP92_003895 [Vanilla planifolia]
MNSSSSASAHFRRTLVISVPGRSRMIGGFPSPTSTLPSSTFPAENLKSQVEEARPSGTSKFISLRRILCRGKKTGGSSSTTPMEEDVEQGFVAGGEGSPSVLKTPTSS